MKFTQNPHHEARPLLGVGEQLDQAGISVGLPPLVANSLIAGLGLTSGWWGFGFIR